MTDEAKGHAPPSTILFPFRYILFSNGTASESVGFKDRLCLMCCTECPLMSRG